MLELLLLLILGLVITVLVLGVRKLSGWTDVKTSPSVWIGVTIAPLSVLMGCCVLQWLRTALANGDANGDAIFGLLLLPTIIVLLINLLALGLVLGGHPPHYK